MCPCLQSQSVAVLEATARSLERKRLAGIPRCYYTSPWPSPTFAADIVKAPSRSRVLARSQDSLADIYKATTHMTS
eukprot:jgi/Chrzof1/13458/UNPLg00541.t1